MLILHIITDRGVFKMDNKSWERKKSEKKLLFLSVLLTWQKDLENSAKYVAWVSGAEVIIILCGVRKWG